MTQSTTHHTQTTSPQTTPLLDLLHQHLEALQQTLDCFLQQPPTPQTTYDLEMQLLQLFRDAARTLLEYAFTQCQPPTLQDCPQRLHYQGEVYRRRPAAPNTISTLFGDIVLNRYRYEALEVGQPSIFPLELHLGIEAGLATPALAEQVGLWAADHEQRRVLALLQRHHGVHWSVDTLRKLTASLRDGLASFRQEAQVSRVLGWLAKAGRGRGPYEPTLAVGRDGVMVPIRQVGSQEAATATVSVYNRRGKRLGTVYLGHMPQPGQGTLTAQLTELLTAVLEQWQQRGGRRPRLVYITDKGYHQQHYYETVLQKMVDPWQPGQRLRWQWVLDFFHVASYVKQLAEALFTDEAAQWRWYKKMRRWLQHREHGVANILRSAWQHLGRQRLTAKQQQAFGKAYRYLRRHRRWMSYAAYRRAGLPIGSGVTEAACKTVFAQRLKRSGMSWEIEGGQVIVSLRVLCLSGVWEQVHQAYLSSRPLPQTASGATFVVPNFKKAG